ncbi:transforming acidic coiled-coil-containing protein 3 isoform X3 [Hydra vulgaris]|uniref:Transforming acidic coiled-coil-containing protein 3 isoform X3 n=2 Tax=Hydra vulgaris TaxID=6087 RepID=A0ABM4BK69_HYDVU
MDSDDDFDSRPVVRRGIKLNNDNLHKSIATEENNDSLTVKQRENSNSTTATLNTNTSKKSFEIYNNELNGVVKDFSKLTVKSKETSNTNNFHADSYTVDNNFYNFQETFKENSMPFKKSIDKNDCLINIPVKASAVVPKEEALCNRATLIDVTSNETLEESAPKPRIKGVKFDLDFVQMSNSSDLTIDDSGVASHNTSRIPQNFDNSPYSFGVLQSFGDDFDDQFKYTNPGDFIDDLDYLEQCGDKDSDAASRQAELARKSLYVRFDPMLQSDSPGATPEKAPLKQDFQDLSSFKNESLFMSDATDGQATSSALTQSVSAQKSFAILSTDSFEESKNAVSKVDKADKSLSGAIDLVEPLLYTQSDLDEVVRTREDNWLKKIDDLELKIKEEIAMRDLLEQDHREKMDSIRRENNDMKQVVAQYEKTIVELTENTHHFNQFSEETLSETVRAKEQLQQELHDAETNLVDAYKRIEKLKFAIDTYKQNEEHLKASVQDFQTKLKRSEERYQQLKQHAAEKVEAANIEINKVRKQKEIDLAGLQASLKKAQSRINSLETIVEQKTKENKEFAQICDDLIKKVSGE